MPDTIQVLAAHLDGLRALEKRLVQAAWFLWCLGYPEQALHTIRDLQPLAEDLAHPYS